MCVCVCVCVTCSFVHLCVNVSERYDWMFSAVSYQEMSPDSKVAVIVGSSLAVVIAVVAVGIAIYCIVIR